MTFPSFSLNLTKLIFLLLSDGQQQQLILPRSPERHPAPHAVAAPQGERRRQPQEGARQPAERTLLRLVHPGPFGPSGQEARLGRGQARHAQAADHAERGPARPGPSTAAGPEAGAVPSAFRDAARVPGPDPARRRRRCGSRRGLRGGERLPAAPVRPGPPGVEASAGRHPSWRKTVSYTTLLFRMLGRKWR